MVVHLRPATAGLPRRDAGAPPTDDMWPNRANPVSPSVIGASREPRQRLPIGEAIAPKCSPYRPVSRGVCPQRFGGLRDCGEDLLLRRPGWRLIDTAPGLSRQGSLTTPTVPAAGSRHRVSWCVAHLTSLHDLQNAGKRPAI